MSIFGVPKRMAVVAGVALLTVSGGTVALAQGTDLLDDRRGGQLEEGSELLPEANISVEEAIAAAEGVASGQVDDVELERFGDRLLYEVEVGKTEVVVDANTGEVVSSDADEDEGGIDDDGEGGTNDEDEGGIDDEDEGDTDDEDSVDFAEAGITPDQAVDVARGAAEGEVGDIELERHAGQLVYDVEVGNSEVVIDANDGSVLSVELDD